MSIGSGNHARTFLHRSPDGRLLQMPVSWYAERGGYWAMSPGYDRPAHLDFRRVIDAGCMSCHNGYPRTPVEDDGAGPKFGEALPEGIDCQRCHGPGQAHVDASKANALDAARRAIVNPAKLDRERQLETCMQCHLEPTSTPLPFQIRRYEHPPFAFSPGQVARAISSSTSITRRGAGATTSSKSRVVRTACSSPRASSAVR